ncbi:TetR/AcrR family transcriptional regulator [Streptomyces sp. NPDC091387]|uniref:TetR/AcrR family transcriptional regulator n=1 Tax=Streptomyces sp. NPDC091387 TaxID=3365998 RepID=UPI0038096A82
MKLDEARDQALDAAENLFYARGVQAVGMAQIRDASGLSLKRLYQLFPAKQDLVEGYLARRDVRWRRSIAEYTSRHEDSKEQVLAVFDWLRQWFEEPGFRGCGWINSYGELGAASPAVTQLVQEHKQAFADWLIDLVGRTGRPASTGQQIFLLAEGAMVTAGITGSSSPAAQARDAASVLLAAQASTDSPR